MKFTLIIFTFNFCLISYVASAESPQSSKPETPKRVSPFLLLQIMPKVIRGIREKFPGQNLEVLFPAVLKEIQETINLPQFSSLSTDAVPGLITTIIDRMIQRLNVLSSSSNGSNGPSQGPSAPNSIDQVPNDREIQTPKPESKGTESVVMSPRNGLPDLAFDRDPTRFNPDVRELESDEEEDELGSEPSVKQEAPPSSLGEYDQFYKIDDQ